MVFATVTWSTSLGKPTGKEPKEPWGLRGYFPPNPNQHIYSMELQRSICSSHEVRDAHYERSDAAAWAW